MKVGTDGVLLGAWAPVQPEVHQCVWDIGCGTGLLSLMLAQRLPLAQVVAIDIDADAVRQARENVGASKWSDRICVVPGDALRCGDALPVPDYIVCNPPFFTDSLTPDNVSRCVARHDNTLPLTALLGLAARRLPAHGAMAMVLPYDRVDELQAEAVFVRLHVAQIVAVHTVSRKVPKRALLLVKPCGGIDAGCVAVEQCIYSAPGVYSDWYKQLTAPFYLHF